jgi:hypothetical protein
MKSNATTTLHIVGNGNSENLFLRSDYPSADIVIGCNFSNPKHRPDLTIMIDIKPFMKFYEGVVLTIPLVISERCENYVLKDMGGWDKVPKGSLLLSDVIPMIHPKERPYPMNSGHHATLYGINEVLEHTKTIHLWGFNSFWSDDMSSLTNAYVQRSEHAKTNNRVSETWRNYWVEIFNSNPSIEFCVHCPNDSNITNHSLTQVKNLKVQKHHESTR